ncbi:MAG: hypothetical protein Kow0022_12280 [Phycisphaerales bacterium]
MKRSQLGVLSLCIPLIAGSAVAQVATPPPGPKPEQPAYVPPPPAPKPKPAQATQPAKPANQQQVRMGGNDPLKGESLRGKLPPLPWKSLAQLDENGRIVRYEDPLDIAALKPNPSVGDASEIMPILAGRRFRMEQIVIDNLDFALQVDDGLLDSLELSDPESMKRVTDMITPLVPPKSITIELFDRGVLSRVQKDFNLEIMKDYQGAINKELSEVYGDKGLGEFMKFIMAESVKEARLALQGMLTEATWRMGEVLDKAGLSSAPGADELRQIRGSAADTPETVAANINRIKELWKPWSFEQKQAFLRAVEDTREDPHAPPIRMLDLVPEGAKEGARGSIGVHPKVPAKPGKGG